MLLYFEDQQGAEQIVIHAAKDFVTNVEKASARTVGTNDDLKVVGDQNTKIEGDQKIEVTGKREALIGVEDKVKSPTIILDAGALLVAKSGAVTQVTAGSMLLCAAPQIEVSGALIQVTGNLITITGGVAVNVTGGAAVNVAGGVVNVKGGSINLNC